MRSPETSRRFTSPSIPALESERLMVPPPSLLPSLEAKVMFIDNIPSNWAKPLDALKSVASSQELS